MDNQYLVISEGYYDGANRGELMKDTPERIEVGDMIGECKVEGLMLR
jgi:hypothetical protein